MRRGAPDQVRGTRSLWHDFRQLGGDIGDGLWLNACKPHARGRMTVLEEIALRQSFRFALLLIGLIAAVIYALVFCYRGPSVAKTVVKAYCVAALKKSI